MKVLDKGYVELVDCLGSDERIVDIARISYGMHKKSTEEQVNRLLTLLLTNHHESPFEQVVLTYKIKAPIFIARQWMRHRTGKYNEQSRRYTKKNWEYYVPDLNLLPKDKCSNLQVQKRIQTMMELQIKDYEDLISLGVKPETARVIMGVGFYTTFYFTIDLRNLLHFLDLRTDSHAQTEMQEYATAVELLASEKLPRVIKIWRDLKKQEKQLI